MQSTEVHRAVASHMLATSLILPDDILLVSRVYIPSRTVVKPILGRGRITRGSTTCAV
jgi:hypothetical protein